MKLFKTALLFHSILLISFVSHAQKETFDVVSYTMPNGWQKQQVEGGVQLFITDSKTGGYAIAIVTKAMASTGSADNDFSSQWKSLLVNTVSSITKPVMLEPVNDNGWEIHSGNGNYMDGNVKGLATLMTATGNNQTTAVVLMTNTQQYQNDLLAFINSLELAKIASSTTTTNNPPAANKVNKSSITGLWIYYNTESSGYVNGSPQLTGGYMRREYLFNANGTYTFRAKDWMVYAKDILFVYETGTYSVNGNQLTLTPKTGKGEWWSKVPNNTKAWGKLVRASTDYKLEKTTYTFDFASYIGSDGTVLLLRSTKPTQRDGSNGDKSDVQEFRYTSRDINNSLIDNPPGFKK